MAAEPGGRYRKVYPRLWRHPVFRALSPAARNVCLYVLAGPQTNRIGVFFFSISVASEDLSMSRRALVRALDKVEGSFEWRFDAAASVFYIPTWWRWNPPDHDNVLRGNLKDLSELPPSRLVEAFADNLAYLSPKLHETFTATIAATYARGPADTPPAQDQYQYQEQKQYNRALARAGIDGATDEAEAQPSAEILEAIANRTLELASATRPFDELADTFRWVAESQYGFKTRFRRRVISEALEGAAARAGVSAPIRSH